MDATNENTALTSVFAEELARCGVRLAVISPGSRSTPLAVALYRNPDIEVQVVLDERSAGFFALGAAAASSVPVVLLCTSGTAAANYHPAVAEADLSAVPLIVLTADRPPELRDIGAGQAIDQIKLFGSAVRWFCEVGNHDADDAGLLHMRATACRAFASAAGEPRPGPVHLNLGFRDPLDPSPSPGSVTATDRLAIHGREHRPLTEVVVSQSAFSVENLPAEVRSVLESSSRILIVAGRQTDPRLRGPVTALAAKLCAPILAEPTSQLRLGPHDRKHVISKYDQIIGGLFVGSDTAAVNPELVIRIGETPTSKRLRIWLAGLQDCRQIVVDPFFGWYEPSRTADVIIRTQPVDFAGRVASQSLPSRDEGFLAAWIVAEQEVDSSASEKEADEEPLTLTPTEIHRALGSSYRNGELVYTASSLAIREQESYLPSSETDVIFLANRGANGIDGLIASGVGASRASGRNTTIVTGELGFQHDLGSLALLGETETEVRIVVINDGGGRIFSRLPQKESMPPEEFDALMRAQSQLNIEAAAAMFDTPYRRISSPGALAHALRETRVGIIELILVSE